MGEKTQSSPSSRNINTTPKPSSSPTFLDPNQPQRQRRQQWRTSDKLLALLTITACILSFAHIFFNSHHLLSHHRNYEHPHHTNVLKNALDKFVRRRTTFKKKKRVSVGNVVAKKQQLVVGDDDAEKESENSTKEKVVEDIQVNADAVVKSNSKEDSNAASDEDGDGENDDEEEEEEEEGADDDDETASGETNTVDENEKPPTLKQKFMSFIGKNGNSIKHDLHPVAHLNCADHGGPSDPHIIDEMVFWVSHYICLS